MILNHISEGNTIQKIGLFASSAEKHNILDLIEPYWRWDTIHEYNTEYFDLDKAASTEKALMDLWKALAEVTKSDKNPALAQQIASVNIDFTENALNAI
ncbi:hypothetical protein CkaCkLH20_12535 [Colletotrichum karsti]|uniref:Uncharacterized protein n=1 Tax=Colletotrichum karsti TaxID=1095194 RepID=A0A9P6LEB8_9PEZI|nr:uncharacterized protein CkaCkLH20_12535 [Colletotrichum karsti]KAF9869926.1 hypothetical protein CkaCkLH20_12535 [Colletotrichum karsti]